MITDVHSQQLEKYLSEKINSTGKTDEQLYEIASGNQDSMVELINAVVVNETYFFREEKQFQFLRNYIQSNFADKDIVIWSAACSSGEEPYSLASLSLGCHARPIVYATDIDTDALIQLKNGVYGDNSFRPDGRSFKNYLDPYIQETKNAAGTKIYAVQSNLKEKIICGRANLLDLAASTCVPQNETVDIIFIRNVFIYFDKTTRDAILKRISAKLKKGGLLFFSISEIAGVNPTDKSIPLVKETKDSVYYFVKGAAGLSAAESVKAGKAIGGGRDVKKSADDIINARKEIQRLFEGPKSEPVTKSVLNEERKTPEQFWEEISKHVEKKTFTEAQKMLESYKPSVNQLCIKYYSQAFVYWAQQDEQKALEFYEKAGMSNPHFWPAFFQVAMVLQNKNEAPLKRKRHDALIKAATILEQGQNEKEQYTYLLGAFSSSYFYQLCNEYLRKELS